MVYPLIVLATFAIVAGWKIPFTGIQPLPDLLEQARPAGTLAEVQGGMLLHELIVPNEHESHEWQYVAPATLVAFGTAVGGVLLAAVIYWWRLLDANEIRQQFRPIYRLLWNKWYFDEIYNALFVQPTLFVGRRVAQFDRRVIDWIIDSLAVLVRGIARAGDAVVDRRVVDGTVNWVAYKTWDLGVGLRTAQTGRIRQYVMFIVVATVALFVLISFRWSFASG
jgi:NADH-quinone oxidoreductase subunit L